MIKIQSAIPFLQPPLKAPVKSGELVVANVTHAPDNLRTSVEALNDSMEEIGSTFSEKIESKLKGGERIRTTRKSMNYRNFVSKIEHLNQLFHLLGSYDSHQMYDQLEQMREGLKQSPSSDCNFIERAGDDPARCDVLLRMVKEEALASGDNELARAAVVQLKNLQQKYGEEICAANNTLLAFADLTSDGRQKQALRNIYYQSIVHQQSALILLDMVLEYLDKESDSARTQFIPTLRTLQRALADDFAALAPSISSGSLRRILHGLRDAAELNHTLASSDALLKQLGDGINKDGAFSAVKLTRRLLEFSHQGVYGSDFKQLATDVVGEQPKQLSRFFSRLFPVVHQLPMSLWSEHEVRNTALQLLRGIITDLTKREQQNQLRHSS